MASRNTTNQKLRKSTWWPQGHAAKWEEGTWLSHLIQWSIVRPSNLLLEQHVKQWKIKWCVSRKSFLVRCKLYKEGFISNYGHIITDTSRRRACLFSLVWATHGFRLSWSQQPSGSGSDSGVPGGEQMDSYPKKRAPLMSPSNEMGEPANATILIQVLCV